MRARSASMESLYPPEDDKTHPATRLPTTKMRPNTGPPKGCAGKSPHDYVNLPVLSQRRYENVGRLLNDPGVQRARERHRQAVEEAAASANKESLYENVKM